MVESEALSRILDARCLGKIVPPQPTLMPRLDRDWRDWALEYM